MLDEQSFGQQADGGGQRCYDSQLMSAPANLSALGRDGGQAILDVQPIVSTVTSSGESRDVGQDQPENQKVRAHITNPGDAGESGQTWREIHKRSADLNHSASADAAGHLTCENQDDAAGSETIPASAGADQGRWQREAHDYRALISDQSLKGGDGQRSRDIHTRTAVASIPSDGALPAKPQAKASSRSPAATIARKGRKGARMLSKSKAITPPSDDIDFDALADALGTPERGARGAPESTSEPPPDPTLATIGPVTAELIRLQRLRRMQIRLTQQINLPAQAVIRQWVGYSTFDKPAIRNPALKRAQTIWGHLTKGKPATLTPADAEIAGYLRQDINEAALWLKWIEKRRDGIETEMEKLAATTPAAALVKATSGLSLKALAIVIAEARGDLGTFRNPDRLFKRLGWANGPDNRAQSDCSKIRKAEVFAAIAEPLLKAQSARYEKDDAGERTDVVTKDAGPYRLAYDSARAHFDRQNEAGAYAERAAWELAHKKGATAGQKKAWEDGKLTADHLHKRAMRVMLKKVLIDLWAASRTPESAAAQD